ncbi:hypothetical protein BGX31_007805 [Mortierella sp. GBA43]|nr:hypothetical protein BGX31_007805 [Mortierella sp. GBA43]
MEPAFIAVALLVMFLAIKVILITCVLKRMKKSRAANPEEPAMSEAAATDLEAVLIIEAMSMPPESSTTAASGSIDPNARTTIVTTDKGEEDNEKSSRHPLSRAKVEPASTIVVPPPHALPKPLKITKRLKEYSLFSKPLPIPPPSPFAGNESGSRQLPSTDLNKAATTERNAEQRSLAR